MDPLMIHDSVENCLPGAVHTENENSHSESNRTLGKIFETSSDEKDNSYDDDVQYRQAEIITSVAEEKCCNEKCKWKRSFMSNVRPGVQSKPLNCPMCGQRGVIGMAGPIRASIGAKEQKLQPEFYSGLFADVNIYANQPIIVHCFGNLPRSRNRMQRNNLDKQFNNMVSNVAWSARKRNKNPFWISV